MGLDMYLTAKRYTSKYQNKELNKKLWELFDLEEYDNLGSAEVSFECGYWRKCNQIHNWFVVNCQSGEDDCREYDVSREKLIELKEVCEKVVKILSEQKTKKVMIKDTFSEKEFEHKIYEDTEEIEALLPTKQGFFFGSYEYDEDYLAEIEDTIRIINKCLEKFGEGFSYRASW
jgi:hypothetical protein